MAEKITPMSYQQEKLYKGRAPMKADRILYWLLKMIFGLIIFTIIYIWNIDKVRIECKSNIFIEFIYVVMWLIVSDIIAHLFALGIEIFYDYKKNYLRSKKPQHNLSKKVWEYSIYTCLRGLCYLFGLIWYIAWLLYPYSQLGPNNLSFLYAWMLVSIGSRLIAKAIAIYLVLK